MPISVEALDAQSCTLTMQQAHQQQAACTLHRLPEQIVHIIAAKLAGGSLENFRRSCRQFREVTALRIQTLDLYELCSWGNSSGNKLPDNAISALQHHPNIKHIILPSGWRHGHIGQLLQHVVSSSHRSSSWLLLESLTLHFHAVSPSTCAVLAGLAPCLTRLELSLDLAFELTTRQVWRIAALSLLPSLKSLVVEPDLRFEALQALSGLSGLQDLRLTGSSHMSHPGSSLKALCRLTQLTSLKLKWTAGRTMSDAGPLVALTGLQKLECWLGANHELPPCSNKPLSGLLTSIGQLSRLTELQLLRGLYLSWELRKIRHLDGLQHLQVLGLHDSLVSEEELSLLSPCTALQDLRVDTLRLTAARSTVVTAAAAAAAAAATAAAAVGTAEALVPPGQMPAAAAVDAATPTAADSQVRAALLMLSRLRRLQCNMLHLGLNQLSEICPHLTHLGPLVDTLVAGGHSVVWNLGAIEGHPALASLGLMVGALGSTCSYHKPLKTANCIGAMAAAVMRVVLQSAGLSRIGAAANGCSMQQVLAVLASLPKLQQLQLWGQAGGLSGKLLASFSTHVQGSSTSTSTSTNGSSSRLLQLQGSQHQLATTGSLTSAVSSLLCSFGSLLTATDMQEGGQLHTAAGVDRCCCSEQPALEQAVEDPSLSAASCMGNSCCSGGSGCANSDSSSEGSSDSSDSSFSSGASSFNNRSDSTLSTDSCCSDGGSSCSSSSSSNINNLIILPAPSGRHHQQQNEQQAGSQDPLAAVPLAATPVRPEALQHGSLRHPGTTKATFDALQPDVRQGKPQLQPVVSSAVAKASLDEAFVVLLLRGLPQLQLLQLQECEYLQQRGQALAVHCCGRYSPAVVVFR